MMIHDDECQGEVEYNPETPIEREYYFCIVCEKKVSIDELEVELFDSPEYNQPYQFNS